MDGWDESFEKKICGNLKVCNRNVIIEFLLMAMLCW